MAQIDIDIDLDDLEWSNNEFNIFVQRQIASLSEETIGLIFCEDKKEDPFSKLTLNQKSAYDYFADNVELISLEDLEQIVSAKQNH